MNFKAPLHIVRFVRSRLFGSLGVLLGYGRIHVFNTDWIVRFSDHAL